MPTNHKILHYNSIRRERESPKYYYSINQFLEPLSMPRQEKKKKRDESMDSVSEVNNQRNEALFQISCCQFCFCMFMWFKEYFRGNDKEFIQ